MKKLTFDNPNLKNKHFKFLQLMGLLYLTFILLTIIIEHRVLMIGHVKILRDRHEITSLLALRLAADLDD